ncbi:unnamed protein product [Clonostachys rosea]|uniref:Uncharacterized protein n=1 Tax=Bionectria ochroleuca TaxID=29856 RepID=A0ABY6UHN7_BIOOC|nr:unnamed protein product [Clonostachys rosea]
MLARGINDETILYDVYRYLRYEGTKTQLRIHRPEDDNFSATFEIPQTRELEFIFPESKRIFVDDIRVCGVGAKRTRWSDSDRLHGELEETSFVSMEARTAHKIIFQPS